MWVLIAVYILRSVVIGTPMEVTALPVTTHPTKAACEAFAQELMTGLHHQLDWVCLPKGSEGIVP